MDNGKHLQETEESIGLGPPVAHIRGLADEVREDDTLAQGAVLHSSGEERRGVNLLPQIKSRSGITLRSTSNEQKAN